ncbi:hypothetical protein NQ315_005679 [Exocentrus adspersus]|uniref:DDE Tnp4 domain-containing protein n=1 Tax=Exocentrus adspersus TaxID=1586481 RepID=A0AAV8VJ10_9CUCU|nr:hypothetical protein NQ315_005679 [Exocentrus adspersus]
MKSCDAEQSFKYTRMTVPIFKKLVNKIPKISKQRRSDGISAEERIAVTLQFLSQGTSMQVLAWNFEIGHTTVHKIIHETCQAIWDVLRAYGSQSDGGIFRHSIFGKRLENDNLNIPKEAVLSGSNIKMPYFLVADEAFPLKQFIMRPYPGKNLSHPKKLFNCRLSRARQMIENSSGTMAHFKHYNKC